MTPLQQLTVVNLTERQYIHLAGLLAVALDDKPIDRDQWTAALKKAKESKP